MNILHANDHKILLNILRILLAKHAPHIKIVEEAGTFDEVLSTLIKIPADVLLLDNIMPRGNIMEVLPLVKKQYPELKIIVFTMFDVSLAYIAQIKKWAEGCLNFGASEVEIIKAIETVYLGDTYYINDFRKFKNNQESN